MALPMVKFKASQATNVICLIGFLDLLGVSMIVTLIPQHILGMGVSSTVAGLIGSVYGFLQAFSSPVMGKWSDNAGRRYSLIICLAICGISYLGMGMAFTAYLFAFSRIPLGLFKHSQMIARAYLTETLPSAQRTAAYGHFNSISVIGFIIGPTIGGHIVQNFGFHVVAICGSVIFLFNALIAWTLLPETPARKSEQTTDSLIHPPRMFSGVQWSDLGDLLLSSFLLGIAFIIHRRNTLILLTNAYQTDSVTNGYIISISSAISTLVGLFSGRLTRFYPNLFSLYKSGTVTQLLLFIGLCFSPTLPSFVALQWFLSAVTAIMRVVSLSMLIERGGGNMNAGMIMGVSQSILACSRTLAPMVAGFALDVGHRVPLYISSILVAMSVGVLYSSIQVRKVLSRCLDKKVKTT